MPARMPALDAWLKSAEAIEFIRTVAPERAFGIHDAQVNDRGLSSINGWLSGEGRHGYRWLAPGEAA